MKTCHWNMNFTDISKHRQVLYGFAALWIMFFHFCTRIPPTGILGVLSGIQQAGSSGVEIFLLLTGMGLYQSMKRTPSAVIFYKKRFLRVFLPAFIVMAIYGVFVDESVVDYVTSITFFGYWFGAEVIWYIPFILTMYLVYPLIFQIQLKKPRAMYLVLLLSIVFSFAAETVAMEMNLLRGISRIPIFILGCILAPCVEKKKRIPGWFLLAALLVTVLMALPWYYTQAERRFYFCYYYFYRSFLFAGYAVVAILVVTQLAQWISKHGSLHFVYHFFAFCGMISLEIYLLYERVWMTLDSFPGFVSDPFSFIKLDIASIICTFILSVLLQKLTNCLIEVYGSVKVPKT